MNMIFIAMFCFGISAYSFRSARDFSKTDIACLGMGLLAVAVYVLSNDPVLSVTLLILSDAFGFAPTFAKSWNEPWSENAAAYAFASLGYVCSIGAMEVLSYTTIGFVIATAALNAGLAASLFFRRRVLAGREDTELPSFICIPSNYAYSKQE